MSQSSMIESATAMGMEGVVISHQSPQGTDSTDATWSHLASLCRQANLEVEFELCWKYPCEGDVGLSCALGELVGSLRNAFECIQSEGHRSLGLKLESGERSHPFDFDQSRLLVPLFDLFMSQAPWLRDRGLRLVFEPPPGLNASLLKTLVRRIGPDILGLTFDTISVLAVADSPLTHVASIADMVDRIRICDAVVWPTVDGFGWDLRAAGQGILPLAQMLGQVQRIRGKKLVAIRSLGGSGQILVHSGDPSSKGRASLRTLKELADRCSHHFATGVIPTPPPLSPVQRTIFEPEQIETSARWIRGLRQLWGIEMEWRQGVLPSPGG